MMSIGQQAPGKTGRLQRLTMLSQGRVDSVVGLTRMTISVPQEQKKALSFCAFFLTKGLHGIHARCTKGREIAGKHRHNQKEELREGQSHRVVRRSMKEGTANDFYAEERPNVVQSGVQHIHVAA